VDDLRAALALWPLLSEGAREDAVRKMRPSLVRTFAAGAGVRNERELELLLEIAVRVLRAELDSQQPTPLPARTKARASSRH
jgi:hypothetical protein